MSVFNVGLSPTKGGGGGNIQSPKSGLDLFFVSIQAYPKVLIEIALPPHPIVCFVDGVYQV